jgi:hypothetical protein
MFYSNAQLVLLINKQAHHTILHRLLATHLAHKLVKHRVNERSSSQAARRSQSEHHALPFCSLLSRPKRMVCYLLTQGRPKRYTFF